MKQRIALFGIMAAALIFAACGGDSGNNGTETDGTSSSSGEISSSGGEVTSSSGDDFSSSGISSGSSSSSDLSSSANGSSSSAKTVSSSSLAGASSSSAETVSSSSSTVASSSSAEAVSSSSSTVVSSSSAEAVSSSSLFAASSSSVVACTNTYGTNTVTDCRDGQTYKTVIIGMQTWMAENLNYADSIAMPNLAGNSWCYGNSADSCAKYGRLYTWTGAMNIASSYQSTLASAVISSPQQGACPAGWHVPTDAEWTTLETTVGGTAGTALKSASGWYGSGNGTDSYGFSALPAGYRNHNGSFLSAGLIANFWSATENDAYYAYNRDLDYDRAYMYTGYNYKTYAFSVRCVKDL